MADSPEDRRRRMHEQNRRSWNAVTPVHNAHKRDQVAFFRGGGSTLFPDELALLGDLGGKDLVHLQCNCGQDTVSLARHAGSVTGVDISDAAIAFATELSEGSGIAARFVRRDLFDWFDETTDRFDVAFTSYGTIGWLADVERWARGVATVVRPGGRLVFLEFHPLVWSLGPQGLTGDPYFIDEPLRESGGVNDYVGDALAPSGFIATEDRFANPEMGWSFQWTVAQIIGALIGAGLRLETIREYPHSNGCELFEGMTRLGGNRFGLPEPLPAVPLMLGLVARRP